MVLLQPAAREGGSGRKAEPANGGGLLEGDRFTGGRLLVTELRDWPEKNDGFLRGTGSEWDQDLLENE